MTNPNFMNGIPELLILQLLKVREMYGYELVRAIRVETGNAIKLGEGVVYPVLHALEREGALKSRRRTVNGRTRVYYAVTAGGMKRLRGLKSQWSRIADALGNLTKEEQHAPGRFDELRERLLRAGVAPRHVRRYVRELRDHLDDLVREGMDGGATRDAATLAARARIGSDDQLAGMMLTRPGLRSMTARFPWATFGVGPVLMLVLVVAAAMLMQGVLILWSPPMPRWSMPWARSSFDVLNWLTTYAAPLAIAAFLCVIGIRQRMARGWIVLGIAVIGVGGGFHEIGVTWSNTPTVPDELRLGFALWPPFPRNMLVAGVLRAAMNLVLVAVGYWLWSHRSWERTTVTGRE